MERTTGILIRRTRFGDTSLICTWLTGDHGKIKTIAKGALRPKSGFAGKLDLFFLADLAYVRSRSGELHPLREVELRMTHEELSGRYSAFELASYFVELVDSTTPVEQPAGETLDLLERGLGYLCRSRPTRNALLHFERELCRLHGIAAVGSSPELIANRLGHFAGRLPTARAALLRSLPPAGDEGES